MSGIFESMSDAQKQAEIQRVIVSSQPYCRYCQKLSPYSYIIDKDTEYQFNFKSIRCSANVEIGVEMINYCNLHVSSKKGGNPCHFCDGKGVITNGEKPQFCPDCYGTGRL